MIPVLISSALISALVSTKTLDYCEADEDGDGPATKPFAHPYATFPTGPSARSMSPASLTYEICVPAGHRGVTR